VTEGGSDRGLDAETAIPPDARAAILAWYDACGRSLSFRGTTDPYAILVSEVMAQQTQVDRVGPAWVAFLAAFPSFEALAAATPADVIRAWAGLGYNRRALSLWRAAKVIVEQHDGQLPADLEALIALPGIGPYTARAVAAIAFGQAVGAVDTNVRRVLGRIAGTPGAIGQALADAVVPTDRPADWTHALMDVGATLCRSARPRCDACPAQRWCRYAADTPAPPGVANRMPRSATPFERTSRWLRGRILQRARAAEGWVTFDAPIGDHDAAAVSAAVRALAGDGLLELDPAAGTPRGRLPLS
jgi:A/G-specific adenine glycosylase